MVVFHLICYKKLSQSSSHLLNEIPSGRWQCQFLSRFLSVVVCVCGQATCSGSGIVCQVRCEIGWCSHMFLAGNLGPHPDVIETTRLLGYSWCSSPIMMISLAIHTPQEHASRNRKLSRLEEKGGRMVSTIEQDKLALSIRGYAQPMMATAPAARRR